MSTRYDLIAISILAIVLVFQVGKSKKAKPARGSQENILPGDNSRQNELASLRTSIKPRSQLSATEDTPKAAQVSKALRTVTLNPHLKEAVSVWSKLSQGQLNIRDLSLIELQDAYAGGLKMLADERDSSNASQILKRLYQITTEMIRRDPNDRLAMELFAVSTIEMVEEKQHSAEIGRWLERNQAMNPGDPVTESLPNGRLGSY